MSKKVSYIHEVNANGQHRIVTIRDGIPKSSKWFEFHEVAVFGVLRANHSAVRDALPQGIFKVTTVSHEEL